MDSSILKEATELAGWSQETEAISIYQALQSLSDSRRKQGKRYPLALVLTCILLAKSAGETTLQAITEWIRLRSAWLQQVLPETRPTFPCAATYSNVLRAVDPAQVNQVLRDLLTRVRAEQREAGEQMHLARDGKTLRGTLGHVAPDEQKMHQLTLYETQTGVILKQQVTDEKENELSIMSSFLTPQLVQGRIITADALHTQHAFCFTVARWQGDFVLIAKKNQPTLHEDLRLFFDSAAC